MIKSIILKNFKCFEDLKLDMENLNVLTGINSMGKSTIIQAFLLLRQTYNINKLKCGLHLNGDLVTIGTGYDVLNRASNEDFIKLSLVDEEDTFTWKFNYNKDSDYQELDNKSQIPLSKLEKINIFKPTFSYISAERLGPQRYYSQSYHKVMDENDIGVNGGYFADYLTERGFNEKVENKNVLNTNCNSDVLMYQMEEWLSEISPGLHLSFEKYAEAGLVNVKYEVAREKFTPHNVGFGISYVAPIILSLLKAKSGDMVILENPEAHLHPKGQRKMGELIAMAAAGGVQVIVETHSDHLLNGIRLSVKNKTISRHRIKLNYFYTHVLEDGSLLHEKSSPAILDNGRLSSWPEGFFDEWDKALDELL